jgi:predicted SAM-dependent methyltransferase
MPLCLNVGCHDIHFKDYVNIDLDPETKPDLLADATKLLDYFQAETVDHIYCGHFLEHFPVEQSLGILKDFYKLLKPYCSVQIVVPDYTKIEELGIEQKEQILLAGGTHKSLMDGPRIIGMLQEAGFPSYSIVPDLKGIGYCRFPEVTWQTGLIATKHPQVVFESPDDKVG